MARIGRRHFLALLAAAPLSACGFHPVYGPAVSGKDGVAAEALAEISVGMIPDRTGQLLRLALQERFERAGIAAARRYDLAVSFGITADSIGVLQNSTPTWTRIVGTATYSLVSQEASRATLTSGVARSEDGFNQYDQQFFASDLETDAVERRIAQALADQIALQLASFFAKRAAGAAG